MNTIPPPEPIKVKQVSVLVTVPDDGKDYTIQIAIVEKVENPHLPDQHANIYRSYIEVPRT